MKILIVDDETTLAELIADEISDELGYETKLAQDGQEGLELCLNEVFDFVITDIMMPKLTGDQFISKLLMEKEEYRTIPIIMITAHAPDNIGEVLENNNVELIKKPFSFDELLGSIKNKLG